MKRAALYSKRDRSRDAAPAGDPGQYANAAAGAPAPAAGRIRGWIRRHERPVLFGAGLVAAASLGALFWAQQPETHEFTQDDIDAAVMHTFETKTVPSQATRAAESVRQSVVRVNGFTDEPVKDADDELKEKEDSPHKDQKDQKDSKDLKDPKKDKDGGSAKNDKPLKDPKDAKSPKGSKDRFARNGRERNDGDEGGAPKDSKSARNGKDKPDSRDARSAKEKEGKDAKDAQPGDGESPKLAERRSRVGTGVVIIDNGTILTNLHVVAGAKRVTVTFSDGLESEVVFVGAQPENDLAVIRAKQIPDDLPAATLGSSQNLRPGDEVVAVGFPFGIGPSVSSGVVSGLNREFSSPEGKRRLTKLIQFDAAVNPGNSGGPLVNMSGEVVGIVTALLNPTEHRTFIGIGFAATIESAGSAVGVPPF